MGVFTVQLLIGQLYLTQKFYVLMPLVYMVNSIGWI
jgi:hypothetical protein